MARWPNNWYVEKNIGIQKFKNDPSLSPEEVSGPVTFNPEQIMSGDDTRAGANSPWAPVWAPPTIPPNGRVLVQATFWQPGVYVLRARADDGALAGDGLVTITVTR